MPDGDEQEQLAPLVAVAHICDPVDDELCTGDVVEKLPLLFRHQPPKWYSEKGNGKFQEEQRAIHKRGYVLQRIGVCKAIVLSFACEIDKHLRRFVERNESKSTDMCVVAHATFVNGQHVDATREGRHWGAIIIPGRQGEDEIIVDFSTFQQLKTIDVASAVCEQGRTRSLTEEGQAKLLEAFAMYLGAARQLDPGEQLLHKTCVKLRSGSA